MVQETHANCAKRIRHGQQQEEWTINQQARDKERKLTAAKAEKKKLEEEQKAKADAASDHDVKELEEVR